MDYLNRNIHNAVLGGTFDRLHTGHKDFLSFAQAKSENIYIGLTSDAYITEKKYDETIQPFAIRYKELRNFFGKEQIEKNVFIFPIDTQYIPAVWNTIPFDAIIVSEDSRHGAETINNKRINEKKKSLTIILSPLTKAQDGNPIASSRIRNGEINREGKLFIQPIWHQHTLLLPDVLRAACQKPFTDVIVTDISSFAVFDPKKIITVGDAVTKQFLDENYRPKIALIDFVIQRKQVYSFIEEIGYTAEDIIATVTNPKGLLTPELTTILVSAFGKIDKISQSVIRIIGEEDLSVLLTILASPLGFTVFYGQPGFGIVRVDVTEQTKEKAFQLVNAFTVE